jgi:hypothetical protein
LIFLESAGSFATTAAFFFWPFGIFGAAGDLR